VNVDLNYQHKLKSHFQSSQNILAYSILGYHITRIPAVIYHRPYSYSDQRTATAGISRLSRKHESLPIVRFAAIQRQKTVVDFHQ